MAAVGTYLQQRRKAAGLTQKDVAEELGVVDRTVSDWEAGRYSPSFDLMVRFIRLINGRIEEVVEVFFGEETPDRRAELEGLAADLSDEELESAIAAIRALRAGVAAPLKGSTRPRQGARQKPRAG
jgi:transcriptional regulator with XRE-family HTH domain